MVSTSPLGFLLLCRRSLLIIGKIALVSVVDLIKYYFASGQNISEQQILN